MTGLVRKATLLTVCGLTLAGAAMAGVPNAGMSTLGAVVVADFPHTNHAPPQNNSINTHTLTTTIRDVDGIPVPFATVTVDFTACGPTVQMAEFQEDQDATVDCLAGTITKTAAADGTIELGPFLARTDSTVLGWPDTPGATPQRNIGPVESFRACASIYAGGFLMGTAVVIFNQFDNNDDFEVNAGDRGFHLDAQGQFLSPISDYRIMYDYNLDHNVNAGDGGLMLDAEGLFLSGVVHVYGDPDYPSDTFCP